MLRNGFGQMDIRPDPETNIKLQAMRQDLLDRYDLFHDIIAEEKFCGEKKQRGRTAMNKKALTTAGIFAVIAFVIFKALGLPLLTDRPRRRDAAGESSQSGPSSHYGRHSDHIRNPDICPGIKEKQRIIGLSFIPANSRY